ncbi:MAG: hypothetical protein N2749_03025 [Clostridia bacterium]|nr:hypothetical protein [Clostridia bacterium]
MLYEIERKFLINNMPDLGSILPIRYERYYLNNDVNNQVRIQKVDDSFQIERKIKDEDNIFRKYKELITEEKFQELKSGCLNGIIRDSYILVLRYIKDYMKDYMKD